MVKKYEKDLKEESPIQFKGCKGISLGGIIIKIKHFLLTTIAAVLVGGSAFADKIHDAAAIGDLAGVQAELDKGVDVNTKGGAAAVPPLLLAALNGHMEVAELLTTNEQIWKERISLVISPLHYAAHHGSKEIVALLITNGAALALRFALGPDSFTSTTGFGLCSQTMPLLLCCSDSNWVRFPSSETAPARLHRLAKNNS
jgi:hypothetical protein